MNEFLSLLANSVEEIFIVLGILFLWGYMKYSVELEVKTIMKKINQDDKIITDV